MSNKIKATLLRPLNGAPIGSDAEYDKVDFDRLEASGAVKAAPDYKNKMASEPDNKELPSLSGMTKDELIAQAESEGMDLSDASNNEDRKEAIEKARK